MVIRQLAPERPAATEFTPDAPSPTGLVAAAAAVRAVAVAASGSFCTAGLAMVLWAVTPGLRDRMSAIALQGGVVAFAAANLMPVLIGGVTLDPAPVAADPRHCRVVGGHRPPRPVPAAGSLPGVGLDPGHRGGLRNRGRGNHPRASDRRRPFRPAGCGRLRRWPSLRRRSGCSAGDRPGTSGGPLPRPVGPGSVCAAAESVSAS